MTHEELDRALIAVIESEKKEKHHEPDILAMLDNARRFFCAEGQYVQVYWMIRAISWLRDTEDRFYPIVQRLMDKLREIECALLNSKTEIT